MVRAFLLAAAIAVLTIHPVGAQSGARRLTTIDALRQFPGFYHLQNVLLRGEFTEDARQLVLRADEHQIRVTLEKGVSSASGPVEVRGHMVDIGRLEPADPRATDFAEARGADSDRWPKPGEELVLRVTDVRPADPPTSISVRALALEPWRYDGQKVTVIGNFRARNLFGDLPGAPGKSTYDFVLRGAEGAIWVTGMRPRGRGFDLDVNRRVDSDRWLEVTGTIAIERGLVHLEAGQMVTASAPTTIEVPIEVEVPAPPPPPVEVVFSSPTAEETDVSPGSQVRIQFSRGLDPKSVEGAFRVGYVGGTVAPPPFQTTYDAGNRAITLRFKEPLERFRTVRVEVLETLKAFDGAPTRPWTLTFSVGG